MLLRLPAQVGIDAHIYHQQITAYSEGGRGNVIRKY